ncbi:hypothetical protein KY289_008149 [Solanum tuberosum]|nr:hypothetical protein KY289_008149 [Solanum tuberosum]
MLESSEDHGHHDGPWSSLRTVVQFVVLVPVGIIEDPNFGKSKGRLRRASQTVNPLTVVVVDVKMPDILVLVRLGLTFNILFLNYFRLDFGYQIIKWLLIYQSFSRIRLCMPNTRSKGSPLLPDDPEFQRTLRKMVNAQEQKAQRNRLGLEAEIDAANNVHETAEGVEGVIHPQHQPISPRGRAQHPTHMMYEEDNVDLDGAGATGAIVLPALPPGVKFTITSTMIQLLNLKGMFRGAAGVDANQHLMNFVAICNSQKIPRVNQTTMRLRLFPLSLTGEATYWLNEIPDDSIKTWNELKEAFLERFFPESKELQMNDEISTHKQLPGDAIHDTWWRFSQKLKKYPNHDLTERHLKHAFYWSLNYVTKPVVDAVCGGSFMRKSFAESMQLLDEVSKNNRAWYTRDAENMYKDQDLDIDEEANYLGNQGANREQGNWQNRDGYRYDRSGVYVPSSNRDRASGSSTGSKLEDIMAKVLDQAIREEDETIQVDDLEETQPKAQPARGKEEEVQENLPL